MAVTDKSVQHPVNRRSLLKGGLMAGGAALGAGLLSKGTPAYAEGSTLSNGDIAILQFLAAAEIIEADLWVQYAELGGIGDNLPVEVDPGQQMNPYQLALQNLDGDATQYITSNTLDEISHFTFLNAYLESKGAKPVNLDKFKTLKGSTAAGSSGIGRLTNLLDLTVDTSWFTRYRSQSNPDLGGGDYPQAVVIKNRRAIPRNNADMNNPTLIQVIANTAAFHFGFIEQGGTSLYAAMAQKASSAEVLQIILGIGGDEICHFLEWVDFAGNAVQSPVAPVTADGLTFPNFFASEENPLFQPSLIFPVPAAFISEDLPLCATVRPITKTAVSAVGAVASFTADGLFIGQSQEFLNTLHSLAVAADRAVRTA
jgi:hypothetical protein